MYYLSETHNLDGWWLIYDDLPKQKGALALVWERELGSKIIQLMNDEEKVLIDKTLLLEIKDAITEAIYDEDGLDGGKGRHLLSAINQNLGVSVCPKCGDDLPPGAKCPYCEYTAILTTGL